MVPSPRPVSSSRPAISEVWCSDPAHSLITISGTHQNRGFGTVLPTPEDVGLIRRVTEAQLVRQEFRS